MRTLQMMEIVKYLRTHASQFALYILAGCTAAVVDFGGYVLLVRWDVWYIVASLISSAFAFVTAFLMHKYVVFRKKDSFGKHLGKYAATEVVNTIINTILLYIFVEYVELPKEGAKLIAMAMVVLWNFFIYKYFVYV